MSWGLRLALCGLGLISTAGSAALQEGTVLRVSFLVAACLWTVALGFLVRERVGKRR